MTQGMSKETDQKVKEISEIADSYFMNTETFIDDEANAVKEVMRYLDISYIKQLLVDFVLYYEVVVDDKKEKK
jgi:hypothetical protein